MSGNPHLVYTIKQSYSILNSEGNKCHVGQLLRGGGYNKHLTNAILLVPKHQLGVSFQNQLDRNESPMCGWFNSG